MPLEEIREVLRAPSTAAAKARLEAHRDRLHAQLLGVQQAATALQELIDNLEVSMNYQVTLKQLSAQPILSLRHKIQASEIGPSAGKAYGELFGYLGQLGIRPVGPPFAIYHDQEFREQDLDVEYCVPTEKRVAGNQRLRGRELEATAAACTLHAGSYDTIGAGYSALAEWMQAHGHESAGAPREVYLVGPGAAPDPPEWRTELLWPVSG
jgi:effector-binding domain-containing protein